MNDIWPTIDRRDPECPERRTVPRGGRRLADLPRPLACPNCHRIEAVRGLAYTRSVRWCHCQACGEVWPRALDL